MRFLLLVLTAALCQSVQAAIISRLIDDFESTSPNIGGTRTLVSDAEIIEFGHNNQALRIKHRRGSTWTENLGGRAIYEFPTLTLFKPFGISFDILEAIHTPGVTESAGFILSINHQFDYQYYIGPIEGPKTFTANFSGLPDNITISDLVITATSREPGFEFVIDNVRFFDTPTVVPEAMTVLFTSVVLGTASAKSFMGRRRRRKRRKLITYLGPQAVYGERASRSLR